MKGKDALAGNAAALLTIVIWGTTFISTKILLHAFSPIEILFFRFCIGLLALCVLPPYRIGRLKPKQELVFAAAGLCGVTLYYLFENIALTYTLAANVGVIIAAAPFFTGILACRLLHTERPGPRFFAGFLVAMAGIGMISFSGASLLRLSPMGDLLAMLAAVVWAVYSILARAIGGYGLHTVQATRRIFFYGLLFMVPVIRFAPFAPDLGRFAQPALLGNMLFLGLGASALCFVTWNYAVKLLGAVKTSIYIYLVPVITVVASVLILGEEVTGLAAAGTGLTLTGLFLSQGKHEGSAKKNTVKSERPPA